MTGNPQPVNSADPEKELSSIIDRMVRNEEVSDEDKRRFRELALVTPEFWSWFTISSDFIRHQLIEKDSHGVSQCVAVTEMDVLKKQLGYEQAPVLDKMLIDHLLTARLRLNYVENKYDSRALDYSSSEDAKLWETRLTGASKRFLMAAEMHAKVSKLLRNTPSVQINIAQAGGKQINVQGNTPA